MCCEEEFKDLEMFNMSFVVAFLKIILVFFVFLVKYKFVNGKTIKKIKLSDKILVLFSMCGLYDDWKIELVGWV